MNVLLPVVTLLITFSANATTFNNSLRLLSKKHLVLGQEILDKNLDTKIKQKKYYTMFMHSKNNKYQLEVVSPTTVKEFTISKKNTTALILKNYENEPMPYQGEITSISICPKKFFPTQFQEKVDQKDIYIVKYYTGSSYNYRVCDDKLMTYSTCSAFFLDKKKSQYFKLKVFTQPETDCVSETRSFFEGLTDLEFK